MRMCDNRTDFGENGTSFDSDMPCQTTGGGSSSMPGRRYGRAPPSCGYCDAACIYNAIEIVFVFGVVANSLVIARVWRDKKLKDPTFVAIAALAFADMMFLGMNSTKSIERVIISMQCLKPVIISRPWYILNSTIWFAANSHVALLAILRYMTIVYPLRSAAYLTPRKVIQLSASIWILGMVLMAILSSLIAVKIVLPGGSSEFVIIWWITVYLIPLIVTVILHSLKVLRVIRSANESTTVATRRSISRMSKIVPLVIFMAAVIPLPKLVYNCLKATRNEAFQSPEVRIHFRGASHVVYLINHTVNPFIYGFLSKKFRTSLKEMFQCMDIACLSKRDTYRSPKQRNISIVTVSTRVGSVSSIGSDVTTTSPNDGIKNGRTLLGRSVSNSYDIA